MLLERVRVDREGTGKAVGHSPGRGPTFRVRAPQGQHAAFLHHFPAGHAPVRPKSARTRFERVGPHPPDPRNPGQTAR